MIPKRCEYLGTYGMSVICLDSYCPSRHECDHTVKPSCWDISHPTAATEQRITSVDVMGEIEQARMNEWGKVLKEFESIIKQRERILNSGEMAHKYTIKMIREKIEELRTIKQEPKP